MLEGDSKITIVALLNEDPSLADYDHLVDKVKVLAKEFLEINFSHVMRQSNSATHNHGFQNRTGPGGRTVKTRNQDKNRFFKPKELDFLLTL